MAYEPLTPAAEPPTDIINGFDEPTLESLRMLSRTEVISACPIQRAPRNRLGGGVYHVLRSVKQ